MPLLYYREQGAKEQGAVEPEQLIFHYCQTSIKSEMLEIYELSTSRFLKKSDIFIKFRSKAPEDYFS